MRKRASTFLLLGVVVALQMPLPIASLASDGGDPEEPARQEGEDRWVPSLAITGGATIQEQQGFADSYHYFPEISLTPEPLRGPVDGDDLAVSPFVGGSLQLMTPALPIPTRPRLFLSGEILPTFASDRDIALEGDPDCFKGPEPNAPCARDETVRLDPFGESAANGVGTKVTARVDTLVFGASLGVAFPFRVGTRQLRIKPSVGWIHYEVEAEGLVVDGSCNPPQQCTPTILDPDGYFRERILEAKGSKKFHGIGPGVDLEVDTGRFGPIGSSLFLGGGAYRVLGNRTFSFGTTETFPEVSVGGEVIFPAETDIAEFAVEVDPWMFRAHVGIRLQWLGSRD